MNKTLKGIPSIGSSNKLNNIRNAFKLRMVALLFFLTLLDLSFKIYFPQVEIISDRIILSVALFILVYLWIREVRDYHDLLFLNKNLRRSHEQLKQAEIDTIAALIKAEEEKDQYTRVHSERVTTIALAIADEMNLADDKKKTLERAGILHDIGKIGISDAILNKTEQLTEEEWKIIKGHSKKGGEILEPLKFLASEKKVMLSHHERYDGKGYPYGLEATEIPVEAQILAVADAFDAMNSARSYREPLTREQIVSELEKSRGTQHSAEVVDVFLSVLKKRPELWQRNRPPV